MNTNQKSQCDYCAFKRTEDQSTLGAERRIEEKYKVLRSLINAPKKPRKMFIGGYDDMTETCFINSPNWPRKKSSQTHCNDFIENNLSLPDALKSRETKMLTEALHDAKNIKSNASNSTKKWYEKPIGIIGIGMFIAILSVLAIYLIRTHLGINL